MFEYINVWILYIMVRYPFLFPILVREDLVYLIDCIESIFDCIESIFN